MPSRSDDKTRYRVGASEDVPDGGRLVVDVGDTTVGVFRVDGRLVAYENACPHQGGPVCQGTMLPAVKEVINDQLIATGFAFDEHDPRIVCPWHGYEFSIKTGRHPAAPLVRLRAVSVEEEAEVIYVAI